jgi:ATP-binding cassette subfamily B multidrug efflux pump
MANLDRQRLLRLLPYLGRDRRRLLLTLVLLIPVAGAAAVQPLLVGQAISALRQEPVLAWLEPLPLAQQLRTLVGLLLVAVFQQAGLRHRYRTPPPGHPHRW